MLFSVFMRVRAGDFTVLMLIFTLLRSPANAYAV